MLKLNKPIRQAKSLEVKALSIKAAFLYLTTNSVCLESVEAINLIIPLPFFLFCSQSLLFGVFSCFTLHWLLLLVNLRHHLTCFGCNSSCALTLRSTKLNDTFFVPGLLYQSTTTGPLSLDLWTPITAEYEKSQLYADKDCKLYLKQVKSNYNHIFFPLISWCVALMLDICVRRF